MANLITVARLMLLAGLVAIAYMAPPAWQIVHLPLAAVIFLMDGLDGWVARRRGEATVFGSIFDIAWHIAVDGAGNAYIGGYAASSNFPTVDPYQPEAGGQGDAFIAELSHSPRWRASDNQTPSITAPGSFATTRNGKDIISVNATGVAKVSRAAARGTTYDAATGKLRASTRVRPGVRLLYLSIFDQGDRQWDSAVFIDRLTVNRKARCRSGLVRSN